MTGDSPGRVLLVDDNAGVAAAMRIMLRRDGRVTLDAVARTAQEGLERFDTHDVVILDLHLPDGEGAELVRRYAQELPGVPLIAHSAGDRADLGDAADLIHTFVSKGKVDELIEALAAAAGR